VKKILIKKKHKKYFLLQRNNYLTSIQKKIRKIFGRYLFTNFFINFFNPISKINYKLNNEFESEFKQLIKYLPNKVENVADIGCGLGIINILINNHFNKKIDFTLIDRDKIESKVSYGFDPKGQFYNNFKLTSDLLIGNGIKKERLNLIDVNNKNNLTTKFDLVISLLSMGYHYPITQYLKFFIKNTHKKTIFIFDIANEHTKFEEISKIFVSTQIIKHSSEIRHNYTRICCKGLIKNSI